MRGHTDSTPRPSAPCGTSSHAAGVCDPTVNPADRERHSRAVIIAISLGRLIHDPLQSDPAEGGLILGALEVLVERRLECRTFGFAGGVDEERH